MTSPIRFAIYYFACTLWLGTVQAADGMPVIPGFDLLQRDSVEKPRQCKSIERLARRLCQRTMIHAGPSADGLALDLLERDFDLVFLSDDAKVDELGPIVIGPEELQNASFVVLLQRAYAAGHTVGVTNALPEEVQRLHQALGFPSGCGQGDDSEVPLVALQQSRDRRPTRLPPG